jgi:hypothetical protein
VFGAKEAVERSAPEVRDLFAARSARLVEQEHAAHSVERELLGCIHSRLLRLSAGALSEIHRRASDRPFGARRRSERHDSRPQPAKQ